ncbi:nuclear autoantigen Sp-100-like isoform X2 [Apodemus sylvaticus]|uniref:nuclear autoantigen Sp-100-like isoform X2 n=1 Tax=Apodemus sylvaticus TaxID=10129 RepID=UPI002243510B|nr:nuclear autoantigen Sp-100-like isoform X2 [Apodemus sylvaticus]
MEGSSLSPRMLPELLECFKRNKVAISHAIKTTFPFLEGLRDNNFITSKMYEDFQDSCRALVPVQKVIYKALDELEKKFDIEVLHELFSAVNLNKYPNLEVIRRRFENVLPNGFFFYRHNGGEPNSQLSLEPGPSGSCSQRSLTWLPSGPSSSEGWRSNDRRNSSLIQGNQTENHQLSKSPNHLVSSLPEDGLSEDLCENEHISRVRRDASTNTGNNTNEPERKPTILPRGPGSVPEDSRELQVQLNNRNATTESRSLLPQNEKISSLPEDGLSEDLCENEHISRVRKDASTNTGNNTNEPERKPTILPRGPGSVPEGAEQLNNEFLISPCSVILVDIKNENASVSLHGNQQTQARTKQNEDSEVIVLSNDNSDGEDNFSEASTLFPSQPAPAYSRKPPTQRTYRRGDTADTNSSIIKRLKRTGLFLVESLFLGWFLRHRLDLFRTFASSCRSIK